MGKGQKYAIEQLIEVVSMFGNVVASGDCNDGDKINLKKSLIALDWVRRQKPSDERSNCNIPHVSGSYYVSNMDNQIHNSNDRLHNIIEHDGWTEISIIDSDGGEIESCCLYKSLKKMLAAIVNAS